MCHRTSNLGFQGKVRTEFQKSWILRFQLAEMPLAYPSEWASWHEELSREKSVSEIISDKNVHWLFNFLSQYEPT